jgi:hypothetical protein
MDTSTGIVSLENLRTFDEMSTYAINISVSDGVHAAATKLTVHLISANSFAPTFGPKSVFEVNFAENQAKGVQIGRVSAVDDDRGDLIRYSIPSEMLDSGLFHLDQDTGDIWSAETFDREEKVRYRQKANKTVRATIF